MYLVPRGRLSWQTLAMWLVLVGLATLILVSCDEPSQSQVISSEISPKDAKLASVLPLVTDLSPEAIVLQEGTVDSQNPLPRGALRGYFRFFQRSGLVFRLGRSEFIEIDMWVNLWATDAEAVRWVESEGHPDLASLSRLVADQLKTTLQGEVLVDSYFLDAISVGDSAAGIGQRVRSSKLLFDGLIVFFARGTASVQINVTGPVDKVHLEDVLRLAKRIDARLQP